MSEKSDFEKCVDVFREVMHAWTRGELQREALQQLKYTGISSEVLSKASDEAESRQKDAWKRIRPALRRLLESDEQAMTFGEYEDAAGDTAIYPDRGNNLIYPALKLAGEAGEVAEKVGKMVRDDAGQLTEERRQALIKELGDVLWYVAALSFELGVTMEEVASGNITKLQSRAERGKLKGDGDER